MSRAMRGRMGGGAARRSDLADQAARGRADPGHDPLPRRPPAAPERIDAHQHFWRLDRGDYGWLTPALGPIHRDFGPGDLWPLLDAAGVHGTILVQAAPTEAETAYLLGVAEAHDRVLGVVGWADLAAPDAPATVERLARRPKLVGLRPMLQDLPDDGWMLRADVARGVDAMMAAGLRFDALVRPRHLPALRRFRDRHPDLPLVVDHCAKPPLASGALDAWAADIARLAAETDVPCKLSGLATEAGAGWRPDDLRPAIDHVLAAFGPDRVMWGSDWPVLNLAGDYAGWHAVARAAVPEADRAAVFGGTARRFYLEGGR